MLTEQDVLNRLREVIDPEIGLNIVDLGLIYSVDVDKENQVHVKMTLTTPGCPMHDAMSTWAQRAVETTPGVAGAVVEVVWDPPWNPAMMTDFAKAQLGWDNKKSGGLLEKWNAGVVECWSSGMLEVDGMLE
jgi:metal-sulfur cluster biosynthetic enzyme